jgi:hypothetical protein
MYAFAQRRDTRVIDEPLYAHYLRVSGAVHPGRDDVLAAQMSDGAAVVREQILGPTDTPVLFVKNMAHHIVDLDRSFLGATRNVLLVRDPRQMLPSLVRQLPRPTLADTGLAVQTELLAQIESMGQEPVVLDARILLLDPRAVLQRLCVLFDIGFDASMLTWSAGARPEDGVWAQHWYHNVHRSTGFAAYAEKKEPFPEQLRALLDECQPHYDELLRRALMAPPQDVGESHAT